MVVRPRTIMIAMAGLLAASVTACAATTNGAAPSGTTTAAPTVSSGAATATGQPSPSGRATTPTTPPGTPPGGSFVLASGEEHLACGITLSVRFIPPSANGGSQDQAFLVGTPPVGSNPDQPAPGTVTPARPGTTATVLGQRFKVVAVDLARQRITLDAMC